jgi:cell division protease FtsH
MPKEQQRVDIKYSEFAEQLVSENIQSVTITDKEISGKLVKSATTTSGGDTRSYTEFHTILPFEDPELVRRLEVRGVAVEARQAGMNWGSILLTSLPWILIIGIWIFLLRQMQGGGSRAFSFGKSRARLLSADAPKVTFDDVAGADEAKEAVDASPRACCFSDRRERARRCSRERWPAKPECRSFRCRVLTS